MSDRPSATDCVELSLPNCHYNEFYSVRPLDCLVYHLFFSAEYQCLPHNRIPTSTPLTEFRCLLPSFPITTTKRYDKLRKTFKNDIGILSTAGKTISKIALQPLFNYQTTIQGSLQKSTGSTPYAPRNCCCKERYLYRLSLHFRRPDERCTSRRSPGSYPHTPPPFPA